MYLNAHTYFSLRYGTLSPQQLAAAAAERGIRSFALTDINNTAAAFELFRACCTHNIQLKLGIEFRQAGVLQFIGLARNTEGLRELHALLTRCSLEQRPLPAAPRDIRHAYIIYPRRLKPLAHFKPYEFLGIRPEYVNQLFGTSVLDYPDRLVAWSPVTFLDEDGYQLHRLLRAVDTNSLHSTVPEATLARPTERLYAPEELTQFYTAYPFLLSQAQALLDGCTFDLDVGSHLNRQSFTGYKSDDYALLEKLAHQGRLARYGAHNDHARKRMEEELRVIRKQDFCPYFLITWDITRYATSAGFHYVGRGSGANSIVAYCLYITDVDPLELDLYFERFINEFRSSPPDFDIDFSWDERDQIHDYILKRYGAEHTALLGTYVTFQGRSIMRELGKVYGLPKAEIDQLIARPQEPCDHPELVAEILHYGKQLEGFPSHLSIHAGGIVIAEQPLNYHTALQLMPKGVPITRLDMYQAEDLGFYKFDVLSQRGLGHIKDAVELVRHNQGKAVDIHAVERIMRDERVRAQLRAAHCMGAFYIESPAMRGLLSKLRCDDYRGLVAASSIIRPGVAGSGMMREYIRRVHHPHGFDYLHPVFETHLGETLGVMVYQEDVMKIVHHFADIPMDECDVLRRIMSGKRAQGDTFERLREKYFRNCRRLGHSDELAHEVWRQVSSFAGYSFCKAHSASYAVESFQSLFLKAYYPLEFITAVINNFGGFYRTEFYFHEARREGATLHPPCVNHSYLLSHLEGSDLYVGFIHVSGLEKQFAQAIAAERQRGGPFASLEQFVARLAVRSAQLELLIRIGAFRFTGRSKYELQWDKQFVFHPDTAQEMSGLLFEAETPLPELPPLPDHPLDQAFDELDLLGFPLCPPFELLRDRHLLEQTITATNLGDYLGRIVTIIGYFVCNKRVRTKHGALMQFGTWEDCYGVHFDTVHFPQILKRRPLRGPGFYRLTGQVVEEFGFYSLEVTDQELLPMVDRIPKYC